MKSITNLIRSLVLAILLVGPSSCVTQAAQETAPTPSPADVKLSFRLDPRITQGLYMGDRWVSPPTYTIVQTGKEATVDVKAYPVDAQQIPMNVGLKWTPSDKKMVAVSQGKGKGQEIKITVRQAGESKLKVASGEFSKEFSIKATYKNEATYVEITQ